MSLGNEQEPKHYELGGMKINLEFGNLIAVDHDVLVEVRAVSICSGVGLDKALVASTIPSWDVVGEVLAVGENVSRVSVGDVVYFTCDGHRSLLWSKVQLVDERLIACKPLSITDNEAVVLSSAALIAWEILFEHLGLDQVGVEQRCSDDLLDDVVLYVSGAASDVGCMLMQLAKAVGDIKVIASVYGLEAKQWALDCGASFVIDEMGDVVSQISACGFDAVDHVVCLTDSEALVESYIEVLKPMGHLALVEVPEGLTLGMLHQKSLSLHVSNVNTRSSALGVDMEEHHKILNAVAEMVDFGFIAPVEAEVIGTISKANIEQARDMIRSGVPFGRVVLEGFEAPEE